ncbi:hypothetical protein, partial [Acinetobacter baumannii]|uniref:hypothetical protein n=1 Tax=Acinetobacter baumannii TaxID=470 RepID=UPI001C0A3B64
IFQGEINFGNPDYLRSFCQENGLTYHISYDGAAEFSAGFYYWHPGMDGDVQGDAIDDGTPTISLNALRERAESGKTITE